MKKWKNSDVWGGYMLNMVILIIGQAMMGEDGINRDHLVSPGLIETEHPVESWVVGYRLDRIPGIELENTGKRDMSGELQDAINRVWEAGGGILYIPAGEYRLERPIEVPPLVGLRGDFVKPGNHGVDLARNTVLAIRHGRGESAKSAAAVTLDGSASIDGFVIWYPEQSGERVTPYSPAIRHSEKLTSWGINTSSRNLYLVNAYHGIAIGDPDNGTCIQLVKNVYGTPLATGIEIWRDADIPRLLNLDFDPAYLGSCGLAGMAAFESVARKHILDRASAIRYHRTDGSELVDIRVRGYRIGLELLDGTQMSNGHWIDNEGHYVNFDFRECLYGVWINNIKDHGTQFFDCYFEAEKKAVFINNPMHGAGIAMFLRCTLMGGEAAISQKWQSKPNKLFSMMFTECTFGNTIVWDSGTLSIVGSRFEFSGDQVRLGEHTVFASLVDNDYQGKVRIEDHSGGKLVLSNNNWTPLDIPEYRYRVDYGSTFQPDRKVLFNVVDFGARAGDGVDDSAAIRSAIEKAHADGGGYVLIPAGTYHIESPIVIRENVELRGIVDFWQHSRAVSQFNTIDQTKGTLLMIDHGKADQDSHTFLLEENAGVTGLSIHYPSQSFNKATNTVEEVFPWLFRLKGNRSYLKHIMASNPWRMVDGFTYSPANIYLGYLCGAPLDVSVHLGENESPMLDNIHFNSWYWNHVFWDNKPSQIKPDTAYKEFLDNWMKANSKAFIFEGTLNLDMYGCFQFCVNKAFTLNKGAKSGLGPSGLIINSGNDWSKFGLYAHANNGLKMVNMHFIDVNMFDDDQNIASIYFAPDMSDSIALYQVSTWGTSPRFVWMEGNPDSRLIITNLSYQLYNTEQLNRVHSGRLQLLNAVRRRDNFPISFSVGPDASALIYSAYFPFPYTVIPDNLVPNQWIDQFGSISR